MMKIFDGIKNVEFTGSEFVKEFGKEVPVFTLTDLPADEWNAKARKSNTAAFVQKFNRQPVGYEEVSSWIHSLISDVEIKNSNHGDAIACL